MPELPYIPNAAYSSGGIEWFVGRPGDEDNSRTLKMME